MVGGVSKVDTPSDFNTYLTLYLQKYLNLFIVYKCKDRVFLRKNKENYLYNGQVLSRFPRFVQKSGVCPYKFKKN